MSIGNSELTTWNQPATEFLSLSSCDQELYIAAVNAGGDPETLLGLLASDGVLEAIAASGADVTLLQSALTPDLFDLAVESEISCLTGFW